MATFVFVVHSTAWLTAAVLLWACLVGASRYQVEYCPKQYTRAALRTKRRTAPVQSQGGILSGIHCKSGQEQRARHEHGALPACEGFGHRSQAI
jgi:hypothetical protein